MCTVAVVAAVSSASLTVNEARLKKLKISWGESNFNTVHTTRKTPFGMFVMSGGTSQVSIYSCNSIAIAVVHGNRLLTESPNSFIPFIYANTPTSTDHKVSLVKYEQ